MITYSSTRGGEQGLSFQQVVEAGLAADGGLFVPNELPFFDAVALNDLKNLPYHQLAHDIILPFVGGDISTDQLADMTKDVYGGSLFRHPSIVPLKEIENQLYLMELFHGPTLAFKDIALQFLARLFDLFAERSGKSLTILGATSGDTGSAAIEACRGRDAIRIIMLHPKGRVSDVQRRQMTTILDDNVVNIAVDGNFDDCQSLVKAAFQDKDIQKNITLTAVNSINWARVLAQVVYYAKASLALGSQNGPVHFSVPTGNFGDIYAGFLARKMGFPIGHLVIATNANDILVRTLRSGVYDRTEALVTSSPSMDISVASNFERYLWTAYGEKTYAISKAFEELKNTGKILLPVEVHRQMIADFQGVALDDAATFDVMKHHHKMTGEILDPHSAIGVGAFKALLKPLIGPKVALATAHPAKFGAAVSAALGLEAELPDHLSDLMSKEEHFVSSPADLQAIKAYLMP